MTEITISGPVAVVLALAFLGMVFAFGRILLGQFEKRMNERFDAQDALRDARFKAIEDRQSVENMRLTNLANEVHGLNNTLPMRYVQRDDWIRFASQIDYKNDRLGVMCNDIQRQLGELIARVNMRKPL